MKENAPAKITGASAAKIKHVIHCKEFLKWERRMLLFRMSAVNAKEAGLLVSLSDRESEQPFANDYDENILFTDGYRESTYKQLVGFAYISSQRVGNLGCFDPWKRKVSAARNSSQQT
ncbi:hypothetical protein SLEP1_g30762 [Rubroshorea leprosula]|uniref:Uncharacterized protein n=1 Tax=Rubroshorea leprosula TaxID=152421 RepID=A0AAV5K6N4_9ROSI|nr:hypothetical protein SLEP1_g30762 [Rubroshorea leprosula]